MYRLQIEVVIAGGGIAGLTMALTCHEIGVPVRVYESAPSLGAFGLGISLQPNAVRELYDLGFEGELAATGLPTREWALVGGDGHDMGTEPRGLDAGTTNSHTGTMNTKFPALGRQRTARGSG